MNKYSKKYLLKFRKNKHFGSEEHKEVGHDLLNKANNSEKLSIAEANFVCDILKLSIPADPKDVINLDDYKVCREYVFKDLYLNYYNNLNGIKPARDYMGPIAVDKKRVDIKKLDEFNNEWFPKLGIFNHKDQLLNLIVSEANKELKEIKRRHETSGKGYNALRAKQKSVSLHSKYLYLTIKEFFEEIENGSVIVNFNEREVHIDSASLVHIMFRHYAGITKQFDTGKSFHLDRSINHFEIPNELKSILEQIQDSGQLPSSQIDFIPIKFNSTIYAIWTGELKTYIKGKGQVTVRKLKTFYPIEDENELNKINGNYDEISIDDNLSYYVRHQV